MDNRNGKWDDDDDDDDDRDWNFHTHLEKTLSPKR